MVGKATYPGERKASAASRRAIRAALAAEYAEPHARPQIAGFSGGNDSAAAAHPSVEQLPSRPRSDRQPRASGTRAPYARACVQPRDMPNSEQSRFHSVTGS